MRRCYVCGNTLPLDQFASDRSRSSGRMRRCRACDNAKRKARYHAIPRPRPDAKPPRPCVVCSGPTPSARHSYCDRCRPTATRYRERERNRQRDRPDNKSRGYGSDHKKMRERVARIVESGRAVCWRCLMPIDPSEAWDLGHDDNDRSRYNGPEHRRCNRATAGRKKQQVHSRRW